MIFNSKAAQKNAGRKLTDHYLLNELWSELDETSQAAMSGGATYTTPDGTKYLEGIKYPVIVRLRQI